VATRADDDVNKVAAPVRGVRLWELGVLAVYAVLGVLGVLGMEALWPSMKRTLAPGSGGSAQMLMAFLIWPAYLVVSMTALTGVFGLVGFSVFVAHRVYRARSVARLG